VVVLVDEKPAPATHEANADATAVQITAPGFALSLGAQDERGKRRDLAAGAVIRVTAGKILTATAAGFQPGTPLVMYILEPTLQLGTFTVGSDGVARGQAEVPLSLRAGRYVVQLNGFTRAGQVGSTSIGIIVQRSRAQHVRTRVKFGVLAATVSRSASLDLATLVRKVPVGARQVTVQVRGFVQPTTKRSNDRELSTARAKSVAGKITRFLRTRKIPARHYVTGWGRAKDSGAAGRRVEVVISYLR